jgi:Protein of unknown function (DUF4058)
MQPNFPGMNPYLENPSLWSEVHTWLMIELARSLNPLITPKYRAAVEKRIYSESLLIGIPDISVFQQNLSSTEASVATQTISTPIKVRIPETEETIERYLEIREVQTKEVITVVEVLSPKNKRTGEGRDQYTTKRQRVLSSQTHLVEIDLLRGGNPMPVMGEVRSDYRILVSRAEQRPEAELYPFNLRDRIPCFALPLKPEDPEPIVDLQDLMQQIYQFAALDFAIDYRTQPIPGLNRENFAWVQTLLPSSTQP